MPALHPVTLVTGASSGIGAALARVFAAKGHDLVLVARREAELAGLADEIAATGRTRPLALTFDLSRMDSTARIGAELAARRLEPEFIVNAAGFGLIGAAGALDRAEQLAMLDLNVRALTDLSLRFLDSLTRRRGGILNVASVAGFLPGPGMAVYYASKAHVLSFSESLHRELAPLGVRVAVLCPGPVPTEFQARAGMPEQPFPRIFIRTAEQVAESAYAGLMRGQCLVVPGLANKAVTLLPRLLPRGLMLALMDRALRKRRKVEPQRGWPRR